LLHEQGPEKAITRLAAQGPTAGLAEIYLRSGRVEEAREVLRTLRAQHPEDDGIAMLYVIALLDVEQPTARLITEARAVAAGLPARARRGIREFIEGRAALAANDIPLAVKRLEIAAHHMPTAPVVLLFLGESQIRAQRRADGLSTMRRAAALPGAPREVGIITARRVLQESAEASTLERAESLAREALRLDRSSLAAVRRLSQLLMARGAHDEAAQLAESLLPQQELSADDHRSLRLQAILCRVSSGDTARALVHLDSLEREEGANGDQDLTNVLRGMAKVQAGDHVTGEQLLSGLVDHERVGFLACVGMVTSMIRRAAFDDATRFAADWRKAHPKAADPGLHMARELRFLHESQRALNEARTYTKRSPTDRTGVIMVLELEDRLGHPERGVEAVRTYVKSVPAAQRGVAQLLLVRALVTYKKAPREAVDLAEQLSSDPSLEVRAVARALMGEAWLTLGETARARGVVDELTADWENDVPATAEARAVETTIRFVRGVLALVDKFYPAAVNDLARCRELEPRNLVVRNNLAWALAHTTDGALRGHQLAVALTKEIQHVPSYWDTRGLAAERSGQVKDAELAYRRALQLFAATTKATDGASTHLRLVKLLNKTQRYADAADEARKLKRTAPGTPAAAEADRFLESGDK